MDKVVGLHQMKSKLIVGLIFWIRNVVMENIGGKMVTIIRETSKMT